MLPGMRILLVMVAVLAAVAARATEVYRWVDASGQAHYSDQWRPGAEKIRIEVDDAPPDAASAARASNPAPAGEAGETRAPAGSRYQSLEIVSPAQEEVLWNIEGQLRVALQVNPDLQPGHGLRLYLDGQDQDIPPGSTSAQLTEVFRGVHTLKAEVVNEAGEVLIESPPTTFVVRQTSIANPSRPIP
jgi:hypothetical protein